MGLQWSGDENEPTFTPKDWEDDKGLLIAFVVLVVAICLLFAFTVWRDDRGMDRIERELDKQEQKESSK